MQVDLYTKSVLTIIAVALSVIAFRGMIPSAKAQTDGPVHVIVDGVGYNAFWNDSSPLLVRVQQ
jgi:hypothetical protein